MENFIRSREGLGFFAKFRELVLILGNLVTELKRANDLKEIELGIKKEEK